MSKTRDNFVEHFGEAQARAVEAAALEHANGINDGNKGSDPFKWCIIIAIGYECVSRDSFREYHGITAPWPDIKEWIKNSGDLDTHDGDFDYLSMFAGVYDEFVSNTSN